MSTTTVAGFAARLDQFVGRAGPSARIRRVLADTESARADAYPLLLPWVSYAGWDRAILAVAGLHATVNHGQNNPKPSTASAISNHHKRQAAQSLGGLMGLAVADGQLDDTLGESRIRAMATVPHPTDLDHAVKQARYIAGRGYSPDWERLTWDLLSLCDTRRDSPDPLMLGTTRSTATKRRWVADYWTFAPAPTPAT